MNPHRRVTDRFTVQSAVLSIVGTCIIGGAIALKFLTDASGFLVIALAVIGGVVIPGTHVLGALRTWKGGGS